VHYRVPRCSLRARLVILIAALSLTGLFTATAMAYVFDTFFSGYVANGVDSGSKYENTARFYLFGEMIGNMGSTSCFIWQDGTGNCTTSNTNYLYASADNKTQKAFCDIKGRGATVTCRAAY
jgi:hypothetical protein